MKCRNYYCDNELPEYRVQKQKQKNTISKKFFCVVCLKHKHIHHPIFIKCARIDCNNLIEFRGGYMFRTNAFCSIICKRRNKFKTKPNELRECKNCGKSFMSHCGDIKHTCSKKCIIQYHNKRRKNRE